MKNVKYVAHICAVFTLLFSLRVTAQETSQQLSKHVPPEVSRRTVAMVGDMPSDAQLNLYIILPLRNQIQLTSLLKRLYDPHSPEYRHFLGVAEFTEQFSPTSEDYQKVVDYATANGFSITSTPANRQIVPIRGTIATIQKAFHVSMKLYQHPTEKRSFFSPDREPTVNVNVPIVHIAGLDNFSLPHKAQTSSPSPANTTGSGPSGAFLPGDMRAAYYPTGSLTGSGQSVGLVEFGGYDIHDVVSTFAGAASYSANGANYLLSYTANGTNYSVPINNVLLNGASGGTANGDDGEQALDVAQPIGMAPGLSQVRVYIAPDVFTNSGTNVYPAGGDDTLIFNTMASEDICKQLGLSWNWRPVSVTANDGIFQQLMAQGQSLFAASGDYGSWPNYAYYYPEEDPYVISVGGTHLTTTGPGGNWVSETGWIRSGGGASPDGFPIPSWQGGLNGVNGASTTLRNAPDVAMEANTDNYFCNVGYCTTGEGGTSYAAPRWAAFMALVNQQAVSNGVYGGVGFINPAVYTIGAGSQYTTVFHDITIGSNGGYTNGSGYDLVTGWGSPKGQPLIDALAPAPAHYWQVQVNRQEYGYNCGSYPFDLFLTQDGTTSSTSWYFYIYLNGQNAPQFTWSLDDSSGNLASGTWTGGAGGGSLPDFQVARTPTGTPTFTINGYYSGVSGCSVSLSGTINATLR